MAPEVVIGANYDAKCDVFSYAIIMYEVLYETTRPYGANAFNVEQRVAKDETFRPTIPEFSGIEQESFTRLAELMKSCWKGNPRDRPDFATICTVFESIK